MTEVVSNCSRLRHFDVLSYPENLDHISAPLFHPPPPSTPPPPDASLEEDQTTLPPPPPRFTPLVTPSQILVSNHLSRSSPHESLFDIYNEYSSRFLGTLPSSHHHQNPHHRRVAGTSTSTIPVVPVERSAETNSCLPYLPAPRTTYVIRRTSSPSPPASPYHISIPYTPAPPPPSSSSAAHCGGSKPLSHMDIPPPLPPPTEPPQPPPAADPITAPVTVSCNGQEGVLYPEKLCRGSRGRCIFYSGTWLTPNQFEFRSGKVRSKYWKRSIFIGDKTMVPFFRDGQLVEHEKTCTCSPWEQRTAYN